MSMVWSISSVN
jgi:hypothetical protein